MGKGLLSRRYDVTPEQVQEAREAINMEALGKNLPRVLIFDIETAPLKAFIWKLWKENVYIDQVISNWFCIAWSAKWLYSSTTMGEVLTKEEVLKEDDTRIVKDLWKLINAADIVIAHNGDKFDIPRINSRFIIHGLPPTKPYYSIDTCKVAKKQFGFSSNKLDALAGYFNIPHKLDTDFSLWKSCLEGDEKALAYMLKYNKKDVEILEEVYLKLRPWIKAHPNIGNLGGIKDACASCGSTNLVEEDGYYYTSVNKYPIYRCLDCGAHSRGRRSISHSTSLTNIGH